METPIQCVRSDELLSLLSELRVLEQAAGRYLFRAQSRSRDPRLRDELAPMVRLAGRRMDEFSQLIAAICGDPGHLSARARLRMERLAGRVDESEVPEIDEMVDLETALGLRMTLRAQWRGLRSVLPFLEEANVHSLLVRLVHDAEEDSIRQIRWIRDVLAERVARKLLEPSGQCQAA